MAGASESVEGDTFRGFVKGALENDGKNHLIGRAVLF